MTISKTKNIIRWSIKYSEWHLPLKLCLKSSKVGAQTGTLKNGVKVVKLQADSKRNQSAPKSVGSEKNAIVN
jgi:hypothetical protein